ncbi:MAG: hypothetical protein A3J74_07640 [Elusimicrobia bacterium RIFCSPHIGHO2_02_FULL_57_9]|nr:MAG: hypothetical protein A3J74_07640 [Elusimicrobia bacterium RIFCSPHIGHO2_02_FULL_57_9]
MANPFHKADEAKEISEVNIVPLADVALVLLIILLVISPMMTQSMLQVKTAGKSAAHPPPVEENIKPPEPELVLVVALGPTGIVVGNHFFSKIEEFIEFMKKELARRQDKKVFLSPGPDVFHGDVVETLEAIKTSGADSVALVQIQTEEQPNAQIQPAQTAP